MLTTFRDLVFRYVLILVGVVAAALSLIVFLQPLDIAPAGLAGASTLLNELFDTPVGLMIFVLNIPIQALAYRLLPDGSRVILRTVMIIAILSLVIDLLGPLVPRKASAETAC